MTKICPNGHEMERKHSGSLTECPNDVYGVGKCIKYNNCPINHDIKNCYWCLTCGKHYAHYELVKVVFT